MGEEKPREVAQVPKYEKAVDLDIARRTEDFTYTADILEKLMRGDIYGVALAVITASKLHQLPTQNQEGLSKELSQSEELKNIGLNEGLRGETLAFMASMGLLRDINFVELDEQLDPKGVLTNEEVIFQSLYSDLEKRFNASNKRLKVVDNTFHQKHSWYKDTSEASPEYKGEIDLREFTDFLYNAGLCGALLRIGHAVAYSLDINEIIEDIKFRPNSLHQKYIEKFYEIIEEYGILQVIKKDLNFPTLGTIRTHRLLPLPFSNIIRVRARNLIDYALLNSSLLYDYYSEYFIKKGHQLDI